MFPLCGSTLKANHKYISPGPSSPITQSSLLPQASHVIPALTVTLSITITITQVLCITVQSFHYHVTLHYQPSQPTPTIDPTLALYPSLHHRAHSVCVCVCVLPLPQNFLIQLFKVPATNIPQDLMNLWLVRKSAKNIRSTGTVRLRFCTYKRVCAATPLKKLGSGTPHSSPRYWPEILLFKWRIAISCSNYYSRLRIHFSSLNTQDYGRRIMVTELSHSHFSLIWINIKTQS